MKKKELIIISGIAVVLLGGVLLTQYLKTQVKTEDMVQVKLRNKVIFEFDITVDGEYEVEGLVSKVYIEVKDEKYHVHDVGCPDKICEKTGWVRKGDPTPIICLPNQIYIVQQIDTH